MRKFDNLKFYKVLELVYLTWYQNADYFISESKNVLKLVYLTYYQKVPISVIHKDYILKIIYLIQHIQKKLYLRIIKEIKP